MVLQEQWFVCFAIWYVLRVIQSRTKKNTKTCKNSMCFKLRSLLFDIFLWWFTNRPFRIFARMPMSYGTILNILRISVCCFRSWTYWSYILFKTTISKFFLASANTKCFNLGKSTCYWNYTFMLHRCLFPQSFPLLN